MQKGFDEAKLEAIRQFLLTREKIYKANKEEEQKKIIETLKSLEPIWKRFKIEKVYLYGSFAYMTFSADSDIDIAVYPDVDYKVFSKLFHYVNRPFRWTVDLRLLSELPFRQKVEKEGILIYERKARHIKK